jgi:hypothetical protein
MTNHRICNNNNRTGATDGAGSVYPPGTPAFILGLMRGSCLLLLQLKCCRGFIYYGKIPSCNIREQLEQ